jgi:DNA mismatch repair protein MutH
MKIHEAIDKLQPHINREFKEIFSPADLNDIILNKGKTGQILEILLGLHLSNTKLDFEDGDLKTNKCNSSGNPTETVFITQISEMFDELITCTNFYTNRVYEKVKNFLYVPVKKVGSPQNWELLPFIHVNLEEDQFKEIKFHLEEDFYSIIKQLKSHIETSRDGFIHTSNGKYIQIRSKDSTPYHPIFSKTYNRLISNKNHAFYFKKEFMLHLKSFH